ncbi:MAG: UbiD family decarboxylase [Deltaproteobacteria bacterium]|nr:UbiD family decarboxylase [Deltaproteobacteria bacterium]
MSRDTGKLRFVDSNYSDLRDWLEQVDHLGELTAIRGADRDLEIPGIWEAVSREGRGIRPALLFDEIPGFSTGFRILFGQLESVRRLALTLRLNLDKADILSCVRACRDRLKQMVLVSPQKANDGPVMENVDTDGKVDLYKFPAPLHHDNDGGRYFGTGHCVISRDPDEGWVNLGTYRCMLFGQQSLGLHMSAGRDGRSMMNKYFSRGEPYKVAVAIGVDPALYLSSTMTIPWGTSEYDFAGGLKGNPIEVIEGPYTKLPIPASAEIVVEGECYPGDTQPEGPFGEWAGYYANNGLSPVLEPVMHVKTVLYRKNPILTCVQPAKPPSDLLKEGIFRSALIWDELEKAGVPNVRGVWCDLAGGTRLFNVVSIKQAYPGHSRQAGMIASQCGSGVYIGRYTVVVDDDIDVTDLQDVIWALSTRADPERSVEIIRRCRSSSADPAISPDLKATSHNPDDTFTSKAVIDACWPYEWKDRAFPVVQVKPELHDKIVKKWGKLLKLNGSVAQSE